MSDHSLRARLAEIRSLQNEGSISDSEAAALRESASQAAREEKADAQFGGVKAPPMIGTKPWSPLGEVTEQAPEIPDHIKVQQLPTVERPNFAEGKTKPRVEKPEVWKGAILPWNTAVVFAILPKAGDPGKIHATKEEIFRLDDGTDEVVAAHRRARELSRDGGWYAAVLQPAHPYAEVSHDLTCRKGCMAETPKGKKPYRVKCILNTLPDCPECGQEAIKATPVGKGWKESKQSLVGIASVDFQPFWGQILSPPDQTAIAMHNRKAGSAGLSRKPETKTEREFREGILQECKKTTANLASVDLPSVPNERAITFTLELSAPFVVRHENYTITEEDRWYFDVAEDLACKRKVGDTVKVPATERVLQVHTEPKPDCPETGKSGARETAKELVLGALDQTLFGQRAVGVNAVCRVRWVETWKDEDGTEHSAACSLSRDEVLLGTEENPYRDDGYVDPETGEQPYAYEPSEDPGMFDEDEDRLTAREFMKLEYEERLGMTREELPEPRQRRPTMHQPSQGREGLWGNCKNSRKGSTYDRRAAAERMYE